MLAGRAPRAQTITATRRSERAEKIYRPVDKVLLHARGCTAVKIVHDLKQRDDIDIVLVQSDPDMESNAAAMLRDRDTPWSASAVRRPTRATSTRVR